MDHAADYLALNKEAWNQRVPAHLNSAFYDLEGFRQGASSLDPIVTDILGDVSGKRLLHLQCHFGQDTLSLQRMGAYCTGVDFSDVAITKAQALAHELDLEAKFVCTDVYSLPDELSGKFDLIFISYGTITWLPDLDEWARVIKHFLDPETGRLVFVEFHPFIWMWNNELTAISYPYFNTQPHSEQFEGTYADKDAQIKTTHVFWNHPLSEVFRSLQRVELEITSFQEYAHSPYDVLAGMIKVDNWKYVQKDFRDRIPYVYSIEATPTRSR